MAHLFRKTSSDRHHGPASTSDDLAAAHTTSTSLHKSDGQHDLRQLKSGGWIGQTRPSLSMIQGENLVLTDRSAEGDALHHTAKSWGYNDGGHAGVLSPSRMAEEAAASIVAHSRNEGVHYRAESAESSGSSRGTSTSSTPTTSSCSGYSPRITEEAKVDGSLDQKQIDSGQAFRHAKATNAPCLPIEAESNKGTRLYWAVRDQMWYFSIYMQGLLGLGAMEPWELALVITVGVGLFALFLLAVVQLPSYTFFTLKRLGYYITGSGHLA